MKVGFHVYLMLRCAELGLNVDVNERWHSENRLSHLSRPKCSEQSEQSEQCWFTRPAVVATNRRHHFHDSSLLKWSVQVVNDTKCWVKGQVVLECYFKYFYDNLYIFFFICIPYYCLILVMEVCASLPSCPSFVIFGMYSVFYPHTECPVRGSRLSHFVCVCNIPMSPLC